MAAYTWVTWDAGWVLHWNTRVEKQIRQAQLLIPQKRCWWTSNDWWLNAESQTRDVQYLNLFQTTHHQHLPSNIYYLPSKYIIYHPTYTIYHPNILSTKFCQHLPTSTIQHIPSIKFWQHLPQIYQHHLTNLSGLGPPLVGTTDGGDFRGKQWRTQREKGNQLQLHIDSRLT